MTPADAKTRWCPFSRTLIADNNNTNYPSGNRNADGSLSTHALCIADSCMLWALTGGPNNDGHCAPTLEAQMLAVRK